MPMPVFCTIAAHAGDGEIHCLAVESTKSDLLILVLLCKFCYLGSVSFYFELEFV